MRTAPRCAWIGRACASSASTRSTRFLADAGFEIGERYGGWRREPFEPASPEIISVARLS